MLAKVFVCVSSVFTLNRDTIAECGTLSIGLHQNKYKYGLYRICNVWHIGVVNVKAHNEYNQTLTNAGMVREVFCLVAFTHVGIGVFVE